MNVANKNLKMRADDGIEYPVKMAGFTHGDYHLEKWVKIMVDADENDKKIKTSTNLIQVIQN